jgi:hypothetical protein
MFSSNDRVAEYFHQRQSKIRTVDDIPAALDDVRKSLGWIAETRSRASTPPATPKVNSSGRRGAFRA